MPLRLISDDEKNKLYDIIQDKGIIWILDTMPRSSCSKVKDTVSQVGRGGGEEMTNHHDISTHKKVMHRFNNHCIEGMKEGRKEA